MEDHATEVHPGLWVSPLPERTWTLDEWGVGLVVTLTEELPPQAARRLQEEGRSTMLLHWPILDGDRPDMDQALLVAGTAARAVESGTKVLVHCQEGWNRSGLVAALTVRELRGCTGKEALAQVQERRPGTLGNEEFAAALRELPAPDRA